MGKGYNLMKSQPISHRPLTFAEWSPLRGHVAVGGCSWSPVRGHSDGMRSDRSGGMSSQQGTWKEEQCISVVANTTHLGHHSCILLLSRFGTYLEKGDHLHLECCQLWLMYTSIYKHSKLVYILQHGCLENIKLNRYTQKLIIIAIWP